MKNKELEKGAENYGEIILLDYFNVLKKHARLIFVVVAISVLATGIISFRMPKIYEAKAVVVPVTQQNPGVGMSSVSASQFAIALPALSNVLEIVNLLESNVLREKIIKKYNLLPVFFEKGSLEDKSEDEKIWTGIRYLENTLKIKLDRRNNIIELSMQFKNPKTAADIINYTLTELTDHMSSETKRVAETNKKYLESLINETSDPFIKSKIYSLIAQQIEQSMMAEVKENFAFKVIDPPKVPDKKIKPNIRLNILLSFVISLFSGIFIAFFKEYIEKVNTRVTGGQQMLAKRLFNAIFALFLIFNSIAYAQQPAGAPPAQAPLQPQPATPLAQPPAPEQMSPQQLEVLKELSPEQRKAIETELGKTGGVLTPEAIEALKARPEFKGLTPEEILKGKETLEKKEVEKKEPPKKEEPKIPEKVLITEEEPKSLFGRFRIVGKYQVIDTKLRPFGYEFFSTAAMRIMTPRKDIPVSSEYTVGPGDEIKILLWGRVNAQYNLVVDRDGNITIPQIGPLHVAGMRFDQMKNYLTQQAEQIIGANINVTMGALKSIQVFVLGEVRRPGSYALDSFSTITNALLAAGGPTEIGSLRNVKLKRKNKTIVVMDFYDFLLRGDKSNDKVLESGDIVFVPTVGPLVGIAGNVKRPAVYELKDKYDLMNLFDLAGGIIPTAYTQQIQVERIQKNERQIVVDINDKDLTKSKDFILQDADLVKVFPIVDKDVNAVYLFGNVKRPGKYEYKPGMKVKDLIKDTTELLGETYFEYALIKRLMLPDLRTELIPFNLGKLLLDNDSTNNIELEPQDNIYIFSKWFFKDKPFVTAEGEVRKGGRFSLDENMRVKDAILTAGGLTKDAYLRKGEIVRVDNKRQFKTIYFNVSKAMADDPEENLLLHNEDRIIIHSIWEERWKEMVSISGEVKKPQEFVLTESMSVSDLIFKAGGLTRDSYLEEAELYRTDWKTKKVTVQRFNLKKALEGDLEHNIKLQDLDKVVVHSIWERVYKKSVSVDGEVTKPGTYQYTENMRVDDLVFAAGNVLESAYLDEAEVSSQIVEDGKSVKIEHRKINLRKALEGDPSHNLLLKPYDRLFVKRLSDWRKEEFVNVLGEVKFPGRYIIKKGETLSSVIKRAGGFTDKAYLKGAVFTRESVKMIQKEKLDQFIKAQEQRLIAETSAITIGTTSKEEAAAEAQSLAQRRELLRLLAQQVTLGRMVIRLDRVERFEGSPDDIPLEGGDTLMVPTPPSSVLVLGAVRNPTAVLYREGENVDYYLNRVGGLTKEADKGELHIIKTDGSAISSFLGIRKVEPGDTIIAPPSVEAKYRPLPFWRDIATIVGQFAITIATLAVIF